MPFCSGLRDTDTALTELEQSCCFGEILQELPGTVREALVPGEDFVAVGKLCHGLTNFPLEGGKDGAHSTHPAAVGHPWKRQDLGQETKDPAPRRGKELPCQSPRAERTNPSLVFATSWKLGWLGVASPEAAGSARPPPQGVCWAAISQFAQDFLFSAFFWLFSSRSVDPPSDLARAVREARLEAEAEKLPLLLFSAACSLRPVLRRRAGPAALLTRPGFTSNP